MISGPTTLQGVGPLMRGIIPDSSTCSVLISFYYTVRGLCYPIETIHQR